MTISEFEFIKAITNAPKNKEVKIGIGDDTALLLLINKYQLITTDTVVDGVHFTRKWFTPEQVGRKAMEINVSDIAAMGGMPENALISLIVPRSLPITWLKKAYRALHKQAEGYGIDIIGGNITQGSTFSVTLTLLGAVTRKNLSLRSSAKPKDFIMVSGQLGSAQAGLRAFQKNIKGFSQVKKAYICPQSQLEHSKRVAPHVNAMVDISDGLLSDLEHVCRQSKCGAVVYKHNLPLNDQAIALAHKLGDDPYLYALNGGEDFELMFTVPEKNISKVNGYIIGEITREKGLFVLENGKKRKAKPAGYDHFSKK